MNHVTVAGGGVLGVQIAIQSAVKGKDVTIWLRSESSITRTKPRLSYFEEQYLNTLKAGIPAPGLAGVNEEDVKKAISSLKIELDLEKALSEADLLIEAISEEAEVKKDFFEKASPFINENMIVVTNSSTLLPSMFADDVPYPQNFLSLHFANHIWINNLAEVMVQPKTSKEAFEKVMAFAREIGMDPVAVLKEKNGYLLNSMLVPFLMSAMDLFVTETGSAEDIDKAWMKGTGAPIGPFRMLDAIGLETALNITNQFVNIPDQLAPFHYKKIAAMLSDRIEKKEKFYS